MFSYLTIVFYFILCFILKTAIESSIWWKFSLSSLWKRANTWSSFAGLLLCCTKLSFKLLSELHCKAIISVQCNGNNLLLTATLSKAILSHENCMSHSVSVLSGTYTYPFFDKFVKNVFCNRIVNSMDWLYSNSVALCIEQLHQVIQSGCLV